MEDELELMRERILKRLDASRQTTDGELEKMIEEELVIKSHESAMSLARREYCEKELFNSMRKLDVVQELIEDETVTEILINGSRNIFYEREGELYRFDRAFASERKLADLIQQIVGKSNRMVNEASPIVDARLEDGSRVNVVLAPVSIDGSAVSIRKFPSKPLTMKSLIERKTLSEEVAGYLGLLTKSGYNIFISGSTGSGKTTFLNALSEFIPEDERVITIEDSAELQIKGVKNLVRLETRDGRTGEAAAIAVRDLIRTALRMRPDRIVVWECRGEEALDMLQAMNTGHDGSLSTGHANSGRDMINRLETMVLMGIELPIGAIRGQIASGIDILVHLGRLRDGSRKVMEVLELEGVETGEIVTRSLFQFVEECERGRAVLGRWIKCETLLHRDKLIAAGFLKELEKYEL